MGQIREQVFDVPWEGGAAESKPMAEVAFSSDKNPATEVSVSEIHTPAFPIFHDSHSPTSSIEGIQR
jgi:hypothetical protein